MTASLLATIDALAGLHVVAIGEAMLDSYLVGTSTRLCQEAPVPVVAVAERRDHPGGAANTAVNLAALGCRVSFLSVVGDDPEGPLLRRELQARGVATEHILTQAGRRTLAKHRVVAGSQLVVRYDQGDTDRIDARTERRLLDHLAELFPRCDAVVVSDYGYGVLAPGVIARLAGLQARTPRVIAVDARDLPAYRSVRVTVVKPNYGEALWLLGSDARLSDGSRADLMAAEGVTVLDRTGAQVAAITLDRDGAVIVERDRPTYRTYAQPADDSRAAGAGDTFISTLAVALAAGATTPAAAELASSAAAIVVGRDGTAACTAADLRHVLLSRDKRLEDATALAAVAEAYRRRGRRIVFTNGCFDILHRGHITHLSRARAPGDVLIVGVNSDASVRRLKGEGRPVMGLEDRLQVLAALSPVDHVVPFDEDVPDRLIEAARPDVFVKGGNYSRDQLPEAALVERLGGRVEILPYVLDRSTTGIIERIRTGTMRQDGGPAWGRDLDGSGDGEAEGGRDDGHGLEPRREPALR